MQAAGSAPDKALAEQPKFLENPPADPALRATVLMALGVNSVRARHRPIPLEHSARLYRAAAPCLPLTNPHLEGRRILSQHDQPITVHEPEQPGLIYQRKDGLDRNPKRSCGPHPSAPGGRWGNR